MVRELHQSKEFSWLRRHHCIRAADPGQHPDSKVALTAINAVKKMQWSKSNSPRVQMYSSAVARTMAGLRSFVKWGDKPEHFVKLMLVKSIYQYVPLIY